MTKAKIFNMIGLIGTTFAAKLKRQGWTLVDETPEYQKEIAQRLIEAKKKLQLGTWMSLI